MLDTGLRQTADSRRLMGFDVKGQITGRQRALFGGEDEERKENRRTPVCQTRCHKLLPWLTDAFHLEVDHDIVHIHLFRLRQPCMRIRLCALLAASCRTP